MNLWDGDRRLTAGCVQAPPASVAFEVFRFLVRDQDLEIVKVALAVVAPRSSEELFQGGTAPFLAHDEVVEGSSEGRGLCLGLRW